MTENEKFIFESIVAQVRMGFLSISEITDNVLEEVDDNDFKEEITEEWVSEQINMEYNKLLADSKLWTKPTDTERLISALDELCQQNIIALHNAGYEMSDGEYEVVEIERALRKKGIMSDGYCFYHGQDLERAILRDQSGLYIAFQKIDNEDDEVTICVGKKVCEILNKYGLPTNWNGEATTRILIPGFKWQHLYNETSRDLLDYEEVVKLMIN